MLKTGAVLIIDDEELIREAVVDILDLVEIKTYAAASGNEGVELYQANRQDIGLVILDMQMPQMSGEETYEKLRNLDPDVKVIFSSGYGEDVSSGVLNGSGNSDSIFFLQKPYPIDGLIELVQRALAS